MRQKGSERKGMTMIELIVVLAVLALMSAIAIPTFARLGYFSRNDLQATARELHSMLKAAKIYAATYRVNTAVAYSLATLDSIDAAGLVYKLPKPIVEHTYRESDGSRLSGDVYVPIDTTETGAFFRPTKPDTAVLPDGPGGNDLRLTLTPIQIFRVEPQFDAGGVRMFDPGNEPRFIASPISPLHWYGNLDRGFPAHIFTPAGKVLVPSANVSERFKIYVGYGPNASPTERYVDEAHTKLRVETIELSQNTGRVQLVQE